MARERFVWMDNVHLQMVSHGHGVYLTGPGWKNWNDTKSPRENVQRILNRDESHFSKELLPHMIVAYQVEDLGNLPIPVCVIIQEAYNRQKTLRTIRNSGAKLVIFTYQNEMPQYQEELEAEDRHCIWIPHSADERTYKDYGMDKTIDVLIVGNMNQDIYPFRNRLARIAWREMRKRSYKVVWLPHPGYELPPKGKALVGENYARTINQAKLVVTCTSRHRYALCKLAEIPLCRALPVSDLPLERQGFFKKTQLVVEPWRTDREIMASMEDLLDDEEELQHRIKVSRDKIEQRLLMKYWAERFIYYARRAIGEVDMAAPHPTTGDDDVS
jgi:hypothetical protein